MGLCNGIGLISLPSGNGVSCTKHKIDYLVFTSTEFAPHEVRWSVFDKTLEKYRIVFIFTCVYCCLLCLNIYPQSNYYFSTVRDYTTVFNVLNILLIIFLSTNGIKSGSTTPSPPKMLYISIKFCKSSISSK